MITKKEITDALLTRGCKPIFVPEIESGKVKYECKCGKIMEKLYKDFKRRGCRYCNSAILRKIPVSCDTKPKDTPDETWRPIEGGRISSLGKEVNSSGKESTLYTEKFRVKVFGEKWTYI